MVDPGERTAWGWLGSRRLVDPEEAGLCRYTPAQDAAIALGEPGEGIVGWRLTHRQAVAALAVAERGPEPLVRYRDVALLASALRDELLVTSLRRIYLEPLERERDGGAALRKILRAYFDRRAQRLFGGSLAGRQPPDGDEPPGEGRAAPRPPPRTHAPPSWRRPSASTPSAHRRRRRLQSRKPAFQIGKALQRPTTRD